MTTSLILAAWYTDISVWFAVFKAVMGVGLVIFVHELGHFLVAKACGVKCEKFYIGFDPPIKIGPIHLPRTLVKFQWGETEYGVGIIPLGGYVKMLGQDDNPGNAAAEAERSKAAKGSAEEDSITTEETSPEEIEWDPRSYPAKSVPQRMAIISAGVTMNAITAVLFAAIAFKMGVSYMPCEVKMAVPGDPAWVAGIQPGDKILRIGESGEPSETLRFRKDLVEHLHLQHLKGSTRTLELLVRSAGEEEAHSIIIHPRERTVQGHTYPSIGIVAQGSILILGSEQQVVPNSSANEVSSKLEGGGLLIRVNGVEVEHHWQYFAVLAQNPDADLLCTFRKKDEKGVTHEYNVTLAPTPLATLGIELEMGPIVAMLPGSPAEVGGLEIGDIILEINGTPAGDPLLLNDRLLREVGNRIELLVQRGDSEKTLSIEPELPNAFLGQFAQSDAPLAALTIGAVFKTGSTIAAIAPNTPAASSALRVGDELTEVLFMVPDVDPEDEVEKALGKMADKPFALAEGQQNWGLINGYLQGLPEETLLKFHYLRDGKNGSETITAVRTDQWHDPLRGLVFQSSEKTREAETLGEAFGLGLRQAREDGTKIFTVLSQLLTGKRSVTDLGGPGTIVVVATMEAKEGIPRLLMFLTMLSINLAILNMLPIPVLDGGHMLFLAYEGLRGKPITDKIAFRLSIAGLGCLLALMLLVISIDFNRWILTPLWG